MLRFSMKRGDLHRPLKLQLKYSKEKELIPVNLSGAIVKFYMRKDKKLKINGDRCIITNPEKGYLKYVWKEEDVSEVGIFNSKVVVIFPNGKKETFPQKDFIEIEII